MSENINFAGSFYFQLCTNVMINVMLYGQNMRQYITNIFIILGRHLSLKYTWTMFNFYATQNIFDTSYLACMLVYQQIQVAYVMGFIENTSPKELFRRCIINFLELEQFLKRKQILPFKEI